MKKKITTEGHVKEVVKDWFDSLGAWSYAPIQNGMGVHGIHDRLGCVPITVTADMVGKRIGLFVSVECKRPGRLGEPRRGMTVHQSDNLRDIIAAGGHSACVDGYDDLRELHAAIFQMELPLG